MRIVALGSIPRARPRRIEEKAVYQLGKIGNNLNQLAKVANATGQTQGGWIKAKVVRTRGLNRNHNPMLKGIFKGAAITAIHQTRTDHPLQRNYERLLDSGIRPPMARLTIARKIAAIVLAMWKNEEVYKPRA